MTYWWEVQFSPDLFSWDKWGDKHHKVEDAIRAYRIATAAYPQYFRVVQCAVVNLEEK